MLSDRRQLVLRALIEEYVARAMPVGSRTIVEQHHLGVSPATVRNDLSALEDAGYISQPHTSAGRIPTDAGYRAFVDDLIASGATSEGMAYEDWTKQMRASADAVDKLIKQTVSELTRLTDCLSLVAEPADDAEDECNISRFGLSRLLRKPEFHDSSSLLPLMEILEDDSVLYRVLDGSTGADRGCDAGDVVVRIGRENQEAELSGVSVIAGFYGRGPARGVVAVIGPTRMDYSHVIRAVKAAQNVLKEE